MERRFGRRTRETGFHDYSVLVGVVQQRLNRANLRLARSLVHLAQLENAVEFEAPILIDRRKAVEKMTRLFARSTWDLHGCEGNGRRLRL